jgi:hypothetical protein
MFSSEDDAQRLLSKIGIHGTTAQAKTPVHRDVLPSVERPGSIQGHNGAASAEVTVLTLPKLWANQSSETQQLAKEMMTEANNLLGQYSNVRLALSSQDMRGH